MSAPAVRKSAFGASAPLLLITCVLACPVHAAAQTDARSPDVISGPPGLGVQGFGRFGVLWPSAKETLEATGIDSAQMDWGAGFSLSRIWRSLFAEVAASRHSDDGQRAFVDDDGNAHPLGVPLTLKASYVDASVGWLFDESDYGGVLPYVVAGAGVVKYEERSPFALPGDDYETSAATYHVGAGVHVPLLRWVGLTGDFRYRWIPGLLGDGGASQAFDEQEFGGAQISVGVWIGTPLRQPRRVPPPKQPEAVEPPPAYQVPQRPSDRGDGVILESAPVFLLPDRTRQPLRTLEAGTTVRILEQAGDWIRIEFPDPSLGPRVGYIERKFVRVPKLP